MSSAAEQFRFRLEMARLRAAIARQPPEVQAQIKEKAMDLTGQVTAAGPVVGGFALLLTAASFNMAAAKAGH